MRVGGSKGEGGALNWSMMNIIVTVETEKCYGTSISLPLEPRSLACKGPELLYKVEINRYDVRELLVASCNILRVRAMTYIMPFPRSRASFMH